MPNEPFVLPCVVRSSRSVLVLDLTVANRTHCYDNNLTEPVAVILQVVRIILERLPSIKWWQANVIVGANGSMLGER